MSRNKPNAASAATPQNVKPAVVGGSPAVVPGTPDFVSDNPMAASAVDEESAEGASVPKPKKYRVINGGMVMIDGCRTPMRAGKLLNAANYNITALKSQGITLTEVVDEASEGLGAQQ